MPRKLLGFLVSHLLAFDAEVKCLRGIRRRLGESYATATHRDDKNDIAGPRHENPLRLSNGFVTFLFSMGRAEDVDANNVVLGRRKV